MLVGGGGDGAIVPATPGGLNRGVGGGVNGGVGIVGGSDLHNDRWLRHLLRNRTTGEPIYRLRARKFCFDRCISEICLLLNSDTGLLGVIGGAAVAAPRPQVDYPLRDAAARAAASNAVVGGGQVSLDPFRDGVQVSVCQ